MRKIHLISPAGSCRPFLDAMDLPTAMELLAVVQKIVGSSYLVTASAEIIEAKEDESKGGRIDDLARATELTRVLGDDEVVAIVLLRGGAWFSRILPHIDFAVLRRRTRRVAVFGFSELTTLVNIVAGYSLAVGIYDMGPAFLTYGLRRYAVRNAKSADDAGGRCWAQQRLGPELQSFFGDVISMVEGSGTGRRVTAGSVRGSLSDSRTAEFVGGNLTVLSTLIGTAHDAAIRPRGKWLLLEDFNDKIERIDRFLAHLTLAGYWDECSGLLLGDFHKGYEDLHPAVVGLLDYHIPRGVAFPILFSADLGHVWPMAPLPLRCPLEIVPTGAGRFEIQWDPAAVRTVE